MPRAGDCMSMPLAQSAQGNGPLASAMFTRRRQDASCQAATTADGSPGLTCKRKAPGFPELLTAKKASAGAIAEQGPPYGDCPMLDREHLQARAPMSQTSAAHGPSSATASMTSVPDNNV